MWLAAVTNEVNEQECHHYFLVNKITKRNSPGLRHTFY